MQVRCEQTCVVRVDGSFVSMQRGKSYELPKEKAESLARAGFVRPAQARKAQQPVTPRPDLEPKGEDPEPPKTGADDEAQDATSEAPAPRKRTSRAKRLDGAPENK